MMEKKKQKYKKIKEKRTPMTISMLILLQGISDWSVTHILLCEVIKNECEIF